MVEKLRKRMASEESGFTLVELLVVMLILGLLAAIAIPSFFNQRDKAKDADAKALARTAQTAIETYATDNQGSYSSAAPGDLTTIEPVLNDATALTVVSAGVDSYEVRTTSTAGSANDFSVIRNTNGTVELECDAPDTDGCPGDTDGDGRGNWGE
jgi:type IV pilus assembly protein PilA